MYTLSINDPFILELAASEDRWNVLRKIVPMGRLGYTSKPDAKATKTKIQIICKDILDANDIHRQMSQNLAQLEMHHENWKMGLYDKAQYEELIGKLI